MKISKKLPYRSRPMTYFILVDKYQVIRWLGVMIERRSQLGVNLLQEDRMFACNKQVTGRGAFACAGHDDFCHPHGVILLISHADP